MKAWKSAVVLMLLSVACLQAQQTTQLTVASIMRDPAWIGSSPGRPFWSLDGSTVYFTWNPENADSDSLYAVPAGGVGRGK